MAQTLRALRAPGLPGVSVPSVFKNSVPSVLNPSVPSVFESTGLGEKKRVGWISPSHPYGSGNSFIGVPGYLLLTVSSAVDSGVSSSSSRGQ